MPRQMLIIKRCQRQGAPPIEPRCRKRVLPARCSRRSADPRTAMGRFGELITDARGLRRGRTGPLPPEPLPRGPGPGARTGRTRQRPPPSPCRCPSGRRPSSRSSQRPCGPSSSAPALRAPAGRGAASGGGTRGTGPRGVGGAPETLPGTPQAYMRLVLTPRPPTHPVMCALRPVETSPVLQMLRAA